MAETYDLILKGGTVVNQDGVAARDLAIRDGRFAAIADLAAMTPGATRSWRSAPLPRRRVSSMPASSPLVPSSLACGSTVSRVPRTIAATVNWVLQPPAALDRFRRRNSLAGQAGEEG